MCKYFCIFDILKEYNAKSDAIGRMQICARTCLYSKGGVVGAIFATKEYDMIPAESIRAAGHIVSADGSMDIHGDHVERKKEGRSHADENSE